MYVLPRFCALVINCTIAIFSECLDGVVTCFQDFVPDMENRLNTSQLNQLSDLLKKFFVFENNRKAGVLSDIRKITTIGDSECPKYISIKLEIIYNLDIVTSTTTAFEVFRPIPYL